MQELCWMTCLAEQWSTQTAQLSNSNSKYFYHYCHWETFFFARWKDRAQRLHRLPFPTDCVADHALCPALCNTSFLLGKPQTELSLAVFAFPATHSWFFSALSLSKYITTHHLLFSTTPRPLYAFLSLHNESLAQIFRFSEEYHHTVYKQFVITVCKQGREGNMLK